MMHCIHWSLILIAMMNCLEATNDEQHRGRKAGKFTLRDGRVVPLFDRTESLWYPSSLKKVWTVPPERSPKNLTDFLDLLSDIKPSTVILQDAPFVRPITDIEPSAVKYFNIKVSGRVFGNLPIIPADDFYAHVFHRLSIMLHALKSCKALCCKHQAEYDKAFVELRWTLRQAIEQKTRFAFDRVKSVWKRRLDSIAKRTDPWKLPFNETSLMKLAVGSHKSVQNIIIGAMYWSLGVMRKYSIFSADLIDEAYSALSFKQDVRFVADKLRNAFFIAVLRSIGARDIICLDFTTERALDLAVLDGAKTFKLFHLWGIWDYDNSLDKLRDMWRSKATIQRGELPNISLRSNFQAAIRSNKRFIWIFFYNSLNDNVLYPNQYSLLTNPVMSRGLEDAEEYFPALLMKISIFALNVVTAIADNRSKQVLYSELSIMLEEWGNQRNIIERFMSSQLDPKITSRLNKMRLKLVNNPGNTSFIEIFESSFELLIWTMKELCDIEDLFWSISKSRHFVLNGQDFGKRLDKLMSEMMERVDSLKNAAEKDVGTEEIILFSIIAFYETAESFDSLILELSKDTLAHFLEDIVLRNVDVSRPMILLLNREMSGISDQIFNNGNWLVRRSKDVSSALEEFRTFTHVSNELKKWQVLSE